MYLKLEKGLSENTIISYENDVLKLSKHCINFDLKNPLNIDKEIISEFIDNEIYSTWTKKFKNKMTWGRVRSCNTVALIIDSIIFCLIAFYRTMPNSILMSILISNVVIKELVTITSVPLIYLTNNISKENS